MTKMYKLRVRVNPGATRRSAVWRGDHLKVNLRNQPVDGKANEELIEYVSELLNIEETQLEIEHGIRSREKKLRLVDVRRAKIVRTMSTLTK